MLFTQETLSVLKNFYTINSSICFTPGNILRTVSPTKTIVAQAKVDMEFTKEFCIYDLMRFMSILSLFEEPNLEIKDRYVTISDSKSNVDYVCAAKNLIALPPEKNIQMPKEVPCSFVLTQSNMAQLTKAMAILGLPEVAITGKDGKLLLQGADSEGKIQDSYSLDIGQSDHDFTVLFKMENLKLLPGDYNVRVAKVGPADKPIPVAHFSGKTQDIQYWIAVQKNSNY